MQRAVRELALGKDTEGDGEFDGQVAEDEVVRRLRGNAAAHSLVGRLAQGESERGADGFRQRWLEDGDLLDGAAVRRA